MPIQPDRLIELPIEEIDVNRRQRKNLGDIECLATSITAIGLLQPILVNSVLPPQSLGKAAYSLVAGRRRLEAHRHLKRETILCCVDDDFADTWDLLQAEVTENTCRRPFSPSEAAGAAEDLLPLAREAARRRQGRCFEGTYENFSEVGLALDQVARLLDLSRPTLEKARKVVAAAREDREQFGDLAERLDRTGKVDGAYQELLRRQTDTPRQPAGYVTVRMNVNGAVKITGLKNKSEIIAHLYILIQKLKDSISSP